MLMLYFQSSTFGVIMSWSYVRVTILHVIGESGRVTRRRWTSLIHTGC